MFLSSVGAPFLRPGLHSHRAPRAAAVKGSAQPRGATRSRLFAASMASTASTGPRWPLHAALRSIRLRASELPASASHNPYSASGSGSGKPIKKRDRNSINWRDPAHRVPMQIRRLSAPSRGPISGEFLSSRPTLVAVEALRWAGVCFRDWPQLTRTAAHGRWAALNVCSQ